MAESHAPQPDAPEPESTGCAVAARKELVLLKRGQRYVFRYEAGQEAQMLTSLIEMARDPANDLTWFDAAVLSHQLGQSFTGQLTRMLKP